MCAKIKTKSDVKGGAAQFLLDLCLSCPSFYWLMKIIDFIERYANIIVRSILALLLLWGMAMVAFDIKPFWHDEWRLIYNLKFKTTNELWGDLEFTQQFPRVYLQLTRIFTSSFDYNYFSLRFPAYFIAVINVLFCFRLMRRIYKQLAIENYLFVLMTVSNFTFIEYLVQTKHYQMEICMGLMALWQALEMISLFENGIKNKFIYTLLCTSFFVAPFFSYTYPIAVAPVFLLVFLQICLWRNEQYKPVHLWQQLLPLLLSAIAIFIFYIIDVRQLMSDEEMRTFWKFRMAGEENRKFTVVKNLWGWFAKMGSGLVFEIIFGFAGIAAVLYTSGTHFNYLKKNIHINTTAQLRLYGLGLTLVVLALFFAGKLPLSEPKFNAFTIPALSILVIYFLSEMKKRKQQNFFKILTIIIFCALSGNVITSIINTFTLPEYKKRMATYHATQKVISLAQKENIPILVTPGVAYPDDINSHMPGMQLITADCILKTFPAYSVKQHLPVLPIQRKDSFAKELQQIPLSYHRVMAGDGFDYKIYER